MDPRAATWWGRAARALRPVVERFAKLVRGHTKREPVRVRTRPRRRRLQSRRVRWSSRAILLLFATGCGGPNDPTSGSDSGASDPEVVSISPTSGPAGGGTLVTITGVGFDPDATTEVLFGSNSATDVFVVSGSLITCTSPAGPVGESVTVSVVTPSGSFPAPDEFLYDTSFPVILSISPTSGPAAGGTVVLITGVGFDLSGTEVLFGSNPATDVSDVSETLITCLSPPGPAGESVTVSVVVPSGSANAPDEFTYDASSPEITSISPTSGPAAGGTAVTITGVGFELAVTTEVLFGSNSAVDVSVVSETTITCSSPAGPSGESVDVSVVTPTETLLLPGSFFYESPPNAELEITWRANSGAIKTGVLTVEFHDETPITSENFRDLAEQGLYDDTLFHRLRFQDKIEGGDFENADGSGGHAAEFHGIGNEADPGTWRIPDEADSSPNHEAGSLAMHLPAGPDSAGSVFYIACPGSALSGADGVNTVFAQSVAGTIDGEDVGFEDLLDALHRIPTGIGYAPNHPVRLVEVRLFEGTGAPPGGGDAPTVELVDPHFGPPQGGSQTLIVGSGFAIDLETPPTVRFGGVDSPSVTLISDTTLLCLPPPGPASTQVDVEVITQAGTAISAGAFDYLAGSVVMMELTWTDVLGAARTGQLVLELFDFAAPLHVENLLLHTNNGMYDQVPFHRIIDGFMIQGGDFENGDGTGGYAASYFGLGDPNDQTTWTVPDEADNGLVHAPGVLSMAKTSAPDSAGSQFFFVDKDSYPSHLDGVHTVFGNAALGFHDEEEVSGLDIIDFISQVETVANDAPAQPVTIVFAQELGGGTAGYGFGGPAGSGRVWNVAAAQQAAAGRAPGDGRLGGVGWAGTRGVFRADGSAGDRLRVTVRSLTPGVEPRAPLAVGARSGRLLLHSRRDLDAAADERCFEAELTVDDRVMVFVSLSPAQWVKAWMETGLSEER